jgi:hypothetical protein
MDRCFKLLVHVKVSEEEARGLISGDDPEGPPFTAVAMQVADQVAKAARKGKLTPFLQKVAQEALEGR